MMNLLTIDETARVLRVSTLTVRRYIDAGKLPAVRVGKGVRVQKEAIDQLVEPIAADDGKQLRGRPMTADDPIWSITAAGRSAGPTDVSENVDRYLAEAYADDHR